MKVYRAHLTAITAVSASADGLLFATVAEDMTAKVFDVVNFGEQPFYIPHLVSFFMIIIQI